jgi:hypothetical protein
MNVAFQGEGKNGVARVKDYNFHCHPLLVADD